MSLIDKIRAQVFERSLQKKLKAKASQERRFVNLESAAIVGLLFDATELDNREKALAYAKTLKKRGKKVKLLGFFDNKLDNPNFTFPYFNRKNIDWALRPKGTSVEEFLQIKFDIFINIATQTQPYSEYIAALTNAQLRVGPSTDQTFCYDLMIDLAGQKTLNAFIQQVEFILRKNEHEA